MSTEQAVWVVFEKDHELNYEGELKEFKKGQKVALDSKAAEALITLQYATEAEAPEDGVDFGKAFDEFSDRIEKLVVGNIQKGMSQASDTLGNAFEVQLDNFAKAKGPNYDLEKDYGLKCPDHFFKCVRELAKQTPDMKYPGLEVFFKGTASGQNISSDSEGNFLVPEPVADTIWSNVEAEPTSLVARSNQFTTANHSLKIPRIFEPSRKTGTGLRNAGILAYWEDEADEHTGSKMTTGKLELGLHKLAVLTYATEEMLDDTGFDITGKFGTLARNAILYSQNQAIVDGTGVGKPKGILRDDALIVVALEAGQGNHTIFHKNVSNMYWRNRNRSSAVWLVHPDLAQQLEFMYFNDDTTNQRPVYLPANQVVNSPFGLLYGRPVIPFEFMPDFGSVGDICFVDMSQYATLQKAGQKIKKARSIHVRFLFDEVAFKWTTRIDGGGLWTSAVEDLNGDTKRSWVTVLASRTGGASSSGI